MFVDRRRWLFSVPLCAALFSSNPCCAQSAARGEPESPATTSAVARSRPVPTRTYWLLGGSVASYATAGLLLGSALSSLRRAQADCVRQCHGDAESIRVRLITADVMGAAGFTCAALALYTYFKRPTIVPGAGTGFSGRAQTAFDVRRVREGAVAELTLRF